MSRKSTHPRKLPGINIQYPISELIVSGQKTIETRTYPIPQKFIGQEMALIETPGKTGTFKARVIATVVFGPSFEYKTKQAFYAESNRTCVTPDSPWKWTPGQKKFGWPIHRVTPLPPTALPKGFKKGIIYAKDVPVIFS